MLKAGPDCNQLAHLVCPVCDPAIWNATNSTAIKTQACFSCCSSSLTVEHLCQDTKSFRLVSKLFGKMPVTATIYQLIDECLRKPGETEVLKSLRTESWNSNWVQGLQLKSKSMVMLLVGNEQHNVSFTHTHARTREVTALIHWE